MVGCIVFMIAAMVSVDEVKFVLPKPRCAELLQKSYCMFTSEHAPRLGLSQILESREDLSEEPKTMW